MPALTTLPPRWRKLSHFDWDTLVQDCEYRFSSQPAASSEQAHPSRQNGISWIISQSFVIFKNVMFNWPHFGQIKSISCFFMGNFTENQVSWDHYISRILRQGQKKTIKISYSWKVMYLDWCSEAQVSCKSLQMLKYRDNKYVNRHSMQVKRTNLILKTLSKNAILPCVRGAGHSPLD